MASVVSAPAVERGLCVRVHVCSPLLLPVQVWITAEKQGVIAGVYFWPGSAVEIKGLHPHYYRKYNK